MENITTANDERHSSWTQDIGNENEEYDDYLGDLMGRLSKSREKECAVKRVSLQIEAMPCGIVNIHEEEDENDNNENEQKLKIPDGGWGWMVVFASLMICLISDGISFSFGLLYIEFLKEFKASKSKTSWIGSLFMAVPLILGPVGSALVDKFGCRKMTIVGGLCLCYVTAVVSIAYWFDKKRTLATGLGACGTGLGTLLYTPLTQYSIEEYGWRGTVLLLAGTFFNFCVCGALMRDPDWLVAEQKKSINESKPWATTEESIVDHLAIDSDNYVPKIIDSQNTGVEKYRRQVKEAQTAEYKLTGVSTTIRRPSDLENIESTNSNNCFRSVINLPTYVKHNEKVPFEVLESLSSNKRLFNVILENYPNLLLCRSNSVYQLNRSSPKDGNYNESTSKSDQQSGTPPLVMTMKLKQSKKNSLMGSGAMLPLESQITSPPQTYTTYNSPDRPFKPMLKRQFSSIQSSYLKSLPYHRSSVMYKGALLNIQRNFKKAASCPDIYNNSTLTIMSEPNSILHRNSIVKVISQLLNKRENNVQKVRRKRSYFQPNSMKKEWYAEVKELFSGILDFSMFLELHFLLLSLSTILLFTWFIVPYFYLTDFVMAHGLTETQATTIISTIGATNTVGMILLGWAGDYPWMNVTKVYAICLIGCGVCCAIMPLFISSFWSLMVIGATFGLFFASNFSFTPAILVELIPLDRFTTAYGLMLLCQGIGNLLGPPLAGWVSDVTRVWDYSFYLAGIWIVISGILIGLIPYTKNRLLWGAGRLENERESIRS
ncbi:uncharacterized protein LOC126904884 isoform X2 [Daktulosphaira vitifoliae]|uniref:uncharacterized protein LOC126904884 isoform X2 n=1 Tax=Daktulosphaira vitifoliae TaxID=58002 RepID=UPI0021AAAA0B|nr:uncharacterized protein LOC126904884 isoform X2 [Daktulosphaira vitifoliae]